MTKQRAKEWNSGIAAALMAFNVMAASAPVLAQETAPEGPRLEESEKKQKTLVIENQYGLSLDNPLVPYGLIGGLGGAALLAFGYGQRRRLKVAIPYMIAGVGAVTFLLNPDFLNNFYQKTPTEIIVAVDETASQTLGKGRAEVTAAVQAEIDKMLGKLGNVNVRIVHVDAADSSHGTEMFSKICNLPDLDYKNVGAVVALTDGQISDASRACNFPSAVPLHVLLSGQPGETDRVVIAEHVPKYGVVGKEETIRVIVDDKGTDETGKPITLTVKGEQDEIRTIAAVTGEPVDINIKLGHVGPNVISIEAEAMDGELTASNNRIVTSVQGVQEAVNILIVSGTPHVGTVPLRKVLKADPDSNHIHLMTLRLPTDIDGTPRSDMSLIEVPLGELKQSIGQFDLVVFDRYPNLNVIPHGHMRTIVQYVKDGGAVLVLSGSEFAGRQSFYRTPIGSILPFKPSGGMSQDDAPPRASADGQRHPVIRNLPGVNALPDTEPGWGPWLRAVDGQKTSGTTVLETKDGKPLLILDKVGKGRTAIILGAEGLPLWHGGYKGGGPYVDLLRKVSHWLMKNPALEEESLSVALSADGKKIIATRRSMEDAVDPVVIHTPSGDDMTLTLAQKEPGLWEAEMPVTRNGIYQARQDGEQSMVAYTHVGPANIREIENIISTDEHLGPLARKTGGTIQRMQDKDGKIITPAFELVREGKAAANGEAMRIRENTATELKGTDRQSLGWLGAVLFVMGAAYGWWTSAGKPNPLRRENKNSGNLNGPEAGV